MLLVWRGKGCGAKVETHTYRNKICTGTQSINISYYPRHFIIFLLIVATVLQSLPAWVTASRWQSEDSDLSITEIWTIGLKTERSIVLQRKESFKETEKMSHFPVRRIHDRCERNTFGVKQNLNIPGYVSSSRNNRALWHGCHTTHTLSISPQVIHLKNRQTVYYFSTLTNTTNLLVSQLIVTAVHVKNWHDIH